MGASHLQLGQFPRYFVTGGSVDAWVITAVVDGMVLRFALGLLWIGTMWMEMKPCGWGRIMQLTLGGATSGHGQPRAWWGPAVSMIAHIKRFAFEDVLGLADHVLMLACRSSRRIAFDEEWVRQIVEGMVASSSMFGTFCFSTKPFSPVAMVRGSLHVVARLFVFTRSIVLMLACDIER